MKRKMMILSVLLAVAMCAGIFSACTSTTTASGSEDSDKTDVTETDSTEKTTEESAAETQAEPEPDVIGKVTYVYDSMLTLEVYAPADGSEITDYTTVDVTALEATGETEYPSIFEDTEYYYVIEGELTTLTAEDVAVDQMVAVITTDEGIQQVIILSGYAQAEATSEETEGETEGSESVLPDLDDLQETDEVIIAQVHEFTENGTLMLYLYGLETGCEDYVITDYASVDFDNYVYTFNTMEYAISDTVTINVVKDGALSPATAFDIGVDDMLVIYHDKEGMECIAVYQSTLDAS